MASAVESKVKEIICEQLGVSEDEVTPDASFIEDLGADSLDIVELVMALEEEYDMEITDEEAVWLSKDIARRIENELEYPGQIKVTVIRETRAVDYAK